MDHLHLRSLLVVRGLCLLAAGCSSSGLGVDQPPRPDLSLPITFAEDGGDPLIAYQHAYGPGTETPFALGPGSPGNNPDPRVRSTSVLLGWAGELTIDLTHAPSSSSVWLTSATLGTVSRLDPRTMRELARYLAITCASLPRGSTAACNGTSGCCAIDDWARFTARQAGLPAPLRQEAPRALLDPARTAVDAEGDVYVASSGSRGGPGTLTKIGASASECIDRNKSGRLDTSKDTNGDGLIDTDCNHDGQPDDLAGVRAKPCGNGLPQEFYGLDDECVLWSSNAAPPGAVSSGLGLATGSASAVPPIAADLWLATLGGDLVRVDRVNGKILEAGRLPIDCGSIDGLAFDPEGVGWVVGRGPSRLCWFDPTSPGRTGVVREPEAGAHASRGVSADRDGNLWIGGGLVQRYSPDRSKGQLRLGSGAWLTLDAAAQGIAVDNRGALAYFAFACQGNRVLRIPASTFAVDMLDRSVSSAGWATVSAPGCTGVGVDLQQDLVFAGSDGVTRVVVDTAGAMKQAAKGNPMGNNRCPLGDTCPVPSDRAAYGDFTGFHATWPPGPLGSYRLMVPGCLDNTLQPADTLWDQVAWVGDLPAGTHISVRARSGASSSFDDATWGERTFTAAAATSPLVLASALVPNLAADNPRAAVGDPWLMVDVALTSDDAKVTPRLQSLSVGYRCPAPR